MWGTEDTPVYTEGSGIMVSDFIKQHDGFLRLNDAEFAVSHMLLSQSSFRQHKFFLNAGSNKKAIP